jgi:pimeloyl-ACP methyl ester carboxylesterase
MGKLPETFDRICWFEDFYFSMVTAAAGRSRIDDLSSWDGRGEAPRVTGRAFTTADGRRLAGFHVKAAHATRGFVLVAHGNAMLAEHILPTFVALEHPSLDIVLYDDRGYGRSEGKTRFLAMFADARHLFDQLRSEIGGAGFAYGLSQGGIVVSNSLLDAAGVRGVAIDGVPGDLPWYLCSSGFDPAERVMKSTIPSESILIISGGRDNVVSRGWMEQLIAAGRTKGAQLVLRDDFPHPFQEPSPAMLGDRLGLIWGHFDRLLLGR